MTSFKEARMAGDLSQPKSSKKIREWGTGGL